MKIKSLFLFMCFVSLNLFADCSGSCNLLKGKLDASDKRYATVEYAIRLLNQKVNPTIIETGIARGGRSDCKGDGCSTIIFAEWVKEHGGTFYSVDISPKSVENAKRALGDLNSYVHIACQDSIQFLQEFEGPIDFLYLDSYDFDYKNPLPSQMHHLYEIQAAYSHLAEDCVVMVDDCDLPHGGKGKYIIEFLLNNGWKIIAKKYQVILMRG